MAAELAFLGLPDGLGFSMEQIDALMSLWRDPARQSSDVKEVAVRQLAELEERQRESENQHRVRIGSKFKVQSAPPKAHFAL